MKCIKVFSRISLPPTSLIFFLHSFYGSLQKLWTVNTVLLTFPCTVNETVRIAFPETVKLFSLNHIHSLWTLCTSDTGGISHENIQVFCALSSLHFHVHAGKQHPKTQRTLVSIARNLFFNHCREALTLNIRSYRRLI